VPFSKTQTVFLIAKCAEKAQSSKRMKEEVRAVSTVISLPAFFGGTFAVF
jgi:hypothetical protein